MSLTWASTSSAIVTTWRRLRPLVMTKASVIARTSPTSRTRMSSPFLAEAARAAVVTQCRMSSSVAPSLSIEALAIEILADDDGDVDDVERLAAQDEPARPKGLAHTLSSLLLGPVVEHDLGLSVGEAVGVAAQHHPGPRGHELAGHPRRRPDGTGAVEDLRTDALWRQARQELAHELIEVALPNAVHLVAARSGVDGLDGKGLVAHIARRQLPNDPRQIRRKGGDDARIFGDAPQPRHPERLVAGEASEIVAFASRAQEAGGVGGRKGGRALLPQHV